MGREIERKFLVVDDRWRPGPAGVHQRQGYLAITERGTVRVRVAAGAANLNIKSPQRGLTRAEFEYPIPLPDAEELLENHCGLVIEKTRYLRAFENRMFEVDLFHGANDGLVIAELELASENETFARPPWLGADVSHDTRYRVAHLSRHPWRTWHQ